VDGRELGPVSFQRITSAFHEVIFKHKINELSSEKNKKRTFMASQPLNQFSVGLERLIVLSHSVNI